jgi:hypothetical protein
MPSPIVIDGSTPYISVDTRQGYFSVQIPPIDFASKGLSVIMVVDTGGLASPTNPIGIGAISGAVFDDGTTVRTITKPFGSVSIFQNGTNGNYVTPQPIIVGNIDPSKYTIQVSTIHTYLSTVQSLSSMVVLNNAAVKIGYFSTGVAAFQGFQPTVEDPFSALKDASTIVSKTLSLSVDTFYTSSLVLSTLTASTLNFSTVFRTGLLTGVSMFAKSTLQTFLQLPDPQDIMFASSGQLYFGSNNLTEMPLAVSSLQSSLNATFGTINNPSYGLSSLSTAVTRASTIYNANPGLSSLSSAIANFDTLISPTTISSMNDTFSSNISSLDSSQGVSSLSTSISLGLSSFVSFNTSTLKTYLNTSMSSLAEGPVISTLLTTFDRALLDVTDVAVGNLYSTVIKSLSTTQCTPLVSTLSTTITQGGLNLNFSSLISTVSTAAAIGFSSLGNGDAISTISTALALGFNNVATGPGVSSLSTTLSRGLNTVNIKTTAFNVSTLSTLIGPSISTLSGQPAQISSFSSLTRNISTTIYDPTVSSLLAVLQSAASSVALTTGLSSLVQEFGYDWSTVVGGPSLSSLSSVLGNGVLTSTGPQIPSTLFFSTLFTSSFGLQTNWPNAPRIYGEMYVSNGIFLLNGNYPQITGSALGNPSSISTQKVTVNMTANFLSTITMTGSLASAYIQASSISITTSTIARSTNSYSLTFMDVLNNNPYTLRVDNNILYWNNSNVFNTDGPGVSSLSSLIGPFFSSVALYPSLFATMSTGLSTMGSNVGSVSTLYADYLKMPTTANIQIGVSTFLMNSISSLVVSTLTTTNATVLSTFVSTLQTSSITLQTLGSLPTNPGNSYVMASTISTGSIINNMYVTTLRASSLSTNFDFAGQIQASTVVARGLNASNLVTNSLNASTLLLRETTGVPGSNFYPLYSLNSNLYYNSTVYQANNTYIDLTLHSLNVSSLIPQAPATLYASSMSFTGKVQADRLRVTQSTNGAGIFLAVEGGTLNGTTGQGRLYSSYDGITWSQVTPSQNSWVGRATNDGAFQGSYHYRIAWNGEYAIAYSRTAYDAGNSGQSNAISYDGINWSPIPRTGGGLIPLTQASILWDGGKWWKFIFQSNNGASLIENGTYTSPDGFSWTPYTWNLSDTSYVPSPFINGLAGLNVASQYISGVEYNGTTMVNYNNVPNTNSNGAIAFSDDLQNARSLLQGGVSKRAFSELEINPAPWSDGYAWYFQNQAGPCNAVVKIYPWRNGTTAIAQTDSGYIQYANTPSDFNFTGGTYLMGAGAYNGQMHVAGQCAAATSPINPLSNLVYSYDGINWKQCKSPTAPSGSVRSLVYAKDKWVCGVTGGSNGSPSIYYSYDGINWQPATGSPATTQNQQFNSYLGSGIEQIIFLSNVKPSVDFMGIRLYNNPEGFSWTNPVSREQKIHAFNSSFMLHNSLYVNTSLDGKSLNVGLCNVKPSTALHLGPGASMYTYALQTSSIYVLPSTTTTTETVLPLSTYNTYVHTSTFLQNFFAGTGVNNGGTGPFTLFGPNALIRHQYGGDSLTLGSPSNVANFLNACGSSNAVIPPSIFTLSTGMTVYYRSGGTNYRRSYQQIGSLFTGQHPVQSLDISGAVVRSQSTFVTSNALGQPSTFFSTIETDYTGFLVSSADEGYLSIYGGGKQLIGSKAIHIVEALPKVRFTAIDRDPAVFGVITNNKNQQFASDGSYALDSDTNWGNDLHGRVRVNSSGEGALWVINLNGSIENGDYLCGSVVPGYARKQDEPEMYNFTVAKATMSCDFSLNTDKYRCEEITYNGKTYRRAFIGVTYHCG